MTEIMKNKKIIIFDMDGVILDSIGGVRNYMQNKYQGITVRRENVPFQAVLCSQLTQ